MHEKVIGKRYVRELFGAIAVYAVLLVAAITYGRPMDPGVLRTVVLASPMIGFGLAIWAIARHIKRMDEYLRRTTLETLAIAAAVTAALSFTYGFLETAGYPRLSMFSVWIVMCGAWVVTALARCLLNR